VLVPFIGYSVGRRFIGYVERGARRLPDMLNRSELVLVRDAFVESFEDDTITNLGDGEIERAMLYAIEIGGARGNARRRIGVGRTRLQVQLGPYVALGVLDEPEGQLPLPYVGSAGPLIQLSDATLGYASRGQPMLRDVGTLFVNRDRMDFVRASEADASAFVGIPVLSDRPAD
jgi:hypothetical protein